MSGRNFNEGAKNKVCEGYCCLLNSISDGRECFKVPMQSKRVFVAKHDPNSNALCVFPKSLVVKKFPKVACEEGDQRFISTAGSRVVMNNFPLELAYQHSFQQQFLIRESVRFVGNYSFSKNKCIRRVVFPSSVEEIGNFSFCICCNLRKAHFKKNSRLKRIGNQSFCYTALESFDVPSNVETIGVEAFRGCANLKSVEFQNHYKLRVIGFQSFFKTGLVSISIPPNVEIIANGTFDCCKNLEVVAFLKGSKLKAIKRWAFGSTAIRSIEIPSNVEEIQDFAFSCCRNLRSVKYLNEFKEMKIGEKAFLNCPI